jgi:hypothetical protein
VSDSKQKKKRELLTSAVMALNTSDSAEFPGREEGRLTSERGREEEASEDGMGFSVSLAALIMTEWDLRGFSGTFRPSIWYNSSCARSKARVSDVGVVVS